MILLKHSYIWCMMTVKKTELILKHWAKQGTDRGRT